MCLQGSTHPAKIHCGSADTAHGSGSVRAVGHEIHTSIRYEVLDLINSGSTSRGPNTSQYSPLETTEEIAPGPS